MAHPQLVSVRDMLDAYAGEAAACCGWLGYQEGKLCCEPGVTLWPQWRIRMRAFLPRIEALLIAADMRHFQNLVDEIKGQLDWDKETTDGIRTLFRGLRGAIESQLSDRWLVLVPQHLVQFYRAPATGWDRVVARFPDAKDEIEEAGRCIALGRDTAAVCHSMRLLELGLKALAKKLKIQEDYRTWDEIIRDINAFIKRMENRQRKPKNWKRDRQFYSEMAVTFKLIKDARRNHVMHTYDPYGPEDAMKVLRGTQDFMGQIAQTI